MSELLPLFPLPNVVLFPNVFLPLHIFEPRYREMVADALDGDRMIGMVLLKPGLGARLRGAAGGLSDRLQRPDHARRAARRRPLQHRAARRRALPDRARRIRAAATAARAWNRWPRARHRPTIAPPCSVSARSSRRCSRRRSNAPAPTSTIPSAMADEDLVHALAQYLDLEPIEKQALLEQDQPAGAGRIARRAAGNEDDDVAHARLAAPRPLNRLVPGNSSV